MTYIPEGWTDNSLATPLSGARLTYMENGIVSVDTALSSKALALVPTAVKTVNYSAANGDFVQVDATNGGLTITLPTAAAGSAVAVRKTDSSANQVTVSAGSSFALKTQGETWIFVGTASGWVAEGELLTLAALDARYQLAAAAGTTLLAANNLSDLTNAAAARTALGLGNAAVRQVGTVSNTVAAGDDSRVVGALQAASNLSDVASAGIARANLGLGGAALLGVGTTAGTVTAGDDSRISGAAQKLNNLSDLTNATAARTNLGLGGAALLNVGSTSGTVAAGDDPRLAAIGYTDAQARNAMPEFLPSDQGFITWSLDPAMAASSSALLAGQMTMIKVKIPTSVIVNSICLRVTTAGSGISNCYAALLNSTGSRVGLTANLATVWTTGGYYEHALTTPYSAAAGIYYVGLLCGSGSTTPPLLARSSASLVVNDGLSAGTYRFSASGTGLTAVPATVTLGSNTAASGAAVSFFVALK